MPILSNGLDVRETGQKDSRGFPLLTDDSGALYTNQNGRIILSRPGGFDQGGFGNFLDSIGAGEFKPEFTRTQQGITGFTFPEEAYRPHLSGEFADQASSEVSPFYDANQALIDKSIKLAEQHKEQIVKFERESQAKTEQRTYGNEDRSFVDALDAMQSGFAGRGTSTSGFRQKALDKQDVERDANLGGIKQGFSDQTQSRDLGFSQFLEDSALSKESQTLSNTRSKNEAIISRQGQLVDQAEVKRKAKLDAANEGFARFLNSGGTA